VGPTVGDFGFGILAELTRLQTSWASQTGKIAAANKSGEVGNLSRTYGCASHLQVLAVADEANGIFLM